MPDWNVAEREQQVSSSEATDEQCYGTGRIHRAYNWGSTPRGAWSDRQKELYQRGYDGKPMKD